MIEDFLKLDPKVQSGIVSAITSLIILSLTALCKMLYDKYSLNYRLQREFVFEQRKNIKEEIIKNKILLLNSAEELNYRLWNFSNNIDHEWHKVPENGWQDSENYYLQSFAYRLLVFLHYIINTDSSVLSYDSTLASKSDDLYLKFIKIFKNYFCDVLMLKDFNYDSSIASNHFFKDDLNHFSKYVENNEGKVINFNGFQQKLQKEYHDIAIVLKYISSIDNRYENINNNVLKGFHLLLMIFLNHFGHDYQRTNYFKMRKLIKSKYPILKNKNGYKDFIKRSKIHRIMFLYLRLLKCE